MKKGSEIIAESNGKIVIRKEDIEFIRHLSHGKTISEAANLCGITIRSGDSALVRLRLLLNCHNTIHVVATLLRQKLID